MKPYAIQTEHLSRTFGAVQAVDDMSLEVPAGIVFGFLGPNGAGKTTTIRLLLGLLEPSQGRAEVLGFDTRTQAGEIRINSGALMEHNGLYERLNAEDNLEFYARIWRMQAGDRKERIHELLMHMGLWDRRKEIVRNWSRGMKQKLAVARTLLHRPSLVFLDEPTAGLDPVGAAALRDDLASLAEKEGVTIFLTTHNLAEAEKLCQQVGVIRQGRLIATGAPDQLRASQGSLQAKIYGTGFSELLLAQLRARPEVASASLVDHHIALELRHEISLAPIVSLVVSSGGQVEEVQKSSASLEDVFLTLMNENSKEA